MWYLKKCVFIRYCFLNYHQCSYEDSFYFPILQVRWFPQTVHCKQNLRQRPQDWTWSVGGESRTMVNKSEPRGISKISKRTWQNLQSNKIWRIFISSSWISTHFTSSMENNLSNMASQTFTHRRRNLRVHPLHLKPETSYKSIAVCSFIKRKFNEYKASHLQPSSTGAAPGRGQDLQWAPVRRLTRPHPKLMTAKVSLRTSRWSHQL